MSEIRGIDTDMMLDPTNGNAFVKGITLDDFTGASGLITQTPITFDTDVTDPNPGPSAVPLPAGFVLLGSALFAIGGTAGRRHRQPAA